MSAWQAFWAAITAFAQWEVLLAVVGYVVVYYVLLFLPALAACVNKAHKLAATTRMED